MTSASSGRTAAGIFWMMLGSGGQIVFQFLLFILLARYLGPQAFGIVGIAAVLIDLANTAGRAGLTEIAIQRKEFSETDASTAFWSSLFFGLTLSAFLLASAGTIARFFETPELEPVLMWLAPISALHAVGAVYEAKLRRGFVFRALAASAISATFVSGFISLGMAIAGFGVFSLVAQRLVYVAWLLAGMIYSTRWVPGLTWDVRSGLRQLASGTSFALSAVLGSSSQRITDLIVGYMLGPIILGYLRIASRALELLQEVSLKQISGVILASLSRLQDDRAAFVAGYLRLVRMTAFFIYPLFLGAAIVAHELIFLIFGPKWLPSAVPMQILSLTGIFLPFTFYKTNALAAVGATRTVLAVNIIEFMLSALVIAVMSRFGMEAAAFGAVLRLLVVTPGILWIVARTTGVPAGETLAAVARPLLGSALMVGTLLILKPYLAALPGIVAIALLAVAGFIVYLGFAWFGNRRQVLEIIGMARALRGGRVARQ